MMGDQTVERYRHTIATCASGTIGTILRQNCDYLHAPVAGRSHATTAVAQYQIQKNHSVDIARKSSSTHGELAET
jgi:hypothetical protein